MRNVRQAQIYDNRQLRLTKPLTKAKFKNAVDIKNKRKSIFAPSISQEREE
jgi:hypothetical protein